MFYLRSRFANFNYIEHLSANAGVVVVFAILVSLPCRCFRCRGPPPPLPPVRPSDLDGDSNDKTRQAPGSAAAALATPLLLPSAAAAAISESQWSFLLANALWPIVVFDACSGRAVRQNHASARLYTVRCGRLERAGGSPTGRGTTCRMGLI